SCNTAKCQPAAWCHRGPALRAHRQTAEASGPIGLNFECDAVTAIASRSTLESLHLENAGDETSASERSLSVVETTENWMRLGRWIGHPWRTGAMIRPRPSVRQRDHFELAAHRDAPCRRVPVGPVATASRLLTRHHPISPKRRLLHSRN